MHKTIKIEDGDICFKLTREGIHTDVYFEIGTKQLMFGWADDFCLSIYDSEREDIFSVENIIIDFGLPINSIFYDIFKNNIPDGYILYADSKPKSSKKHVKFIFDDKGINIIIESDHKAEFNDMSSALTFYGYSGGDRQQTDYKDAFVALLTEIIKFGETYDGPKKCMSVK